MTDRPKMIKRLNSLIGIRSNIMARVAVGDKIARDDPGFLRWSSIPNVYTILDKVFDLFLQDFRMDGMTKHTVLR